MPRTTFRGLARLLLGASWYFEPLYLSFRLPFVRQAQEEDVARINADGTCTQELCWSIWVIQALGRVTHFAATSENPDAGMSSFFALPLLPVLALGVFLLVHRLCRYPCTVNGADHYHYTYTYIPFLRSCMWGCQ
jgi:hypothetical protein